MEILKNEEYTSLQWDMFVCSILLNITAGIFLFSKAVYEWRSKYSKSSSNQSNSTMNTPIERKSGNQFAKLVCTLLLTVASLYLTISSCTTTDVLSNPFFHKDSAHIRSEHCILVSCILNLVHTMNFSGRGNRRLHHIVQNIVIIMILLTHLYTNEAAIWVVTIQLIILDTVMTYIKAFSRVTHVTHVQHRNYQRASAVAIGITLAFRVVGAALLHSVACALSWTRFFDMSSLSVTMFFFGSTFFLLYNIWYARVLVQQYEYKRKDVQNECSLEKKLKRTEVTAKDTKVKVEDASTYKPQGIENVYYIDNL